VNRRLGRAAAVLFVACAALFVVGVVAERTSAHSEAVATESHDESAEAPGHDEAAEHREGAADHAESETVLGIDVESPAAVTLAVVASLALGVASWLQNRRWLALLSVAFGVAFAVFDIAEIGHQLDESRTGLAVLAGVLAAGHLAATGTAGLSTRPRRRA
jgi:Flp pilus assembly protein TadB